jgi:urease accessory protein
MLGTLHALWQADGGFPSGAFAFSYGVEGVVASRQVATTDEFARLVAAILRYRWATYDRIALLRSFRAGGNLARIAAIDREIEASTLVESLRSGSRRNGAAFLAAHSRLGDESACTLRAALHNGECLGHIVVMQGAVWSAIGLDEGLAQLTSGYSVASGLIMAAVRLGSIGALQGQAVLKASLPLIHELASRKASEDAELQSFVPYLDIAAARHAQADLRLFAN